MQRNLKKRNLMQQCLNKLIYSSSANQRDGFVIDKPMVGYTMYRLTIPRLITVTILESLPAPFVAMHRYFLTAFV